MATPAEPHIQYCGKKIRIFATNQDLKFWKENPARLFAIRRANSPESCRAKAGSEHPLEPHWIVLKKESDRVCQGRLISVWIGRERTDYSAFFAALDDDDLKALLH